MSHTVGNELSFLDPAIVARIGSLELIARTIVEGAVSYTHLTLPTTPYV